MSNPNLSLYYKIQDEITNIKENTKYGNLFTYSMLLRGSINNVSFLFSFLIPLAPNR